MTDRLEITVPVDIQKFGQNQKAKHRWSVNDKQKAAVNAARAAWLAAGQPTMKPPVRVSIIVRRARRLDEFNIHGACKGLIDGLFKNGITPDDGPKHVQAGTITQERDKRFKGNESVTFIVERMRT